MRLVTKEERDEFFLRFRRAALHLEMRDSYGTQVEKPHLRKWERGESDDIEWLKPWFDTVRLGTQSGKVFRRMRIISEPITDYIRWEHMDAHLFVEAGEDIRWLPRKLVSAIAFPGNDFGCSTLIRSSSAFSQGTAMSWNGSSTPTRRWCSCASPPSTLPGSSRSRTASTSLADREP